MVRPVSFDVLLDGDLKIVFELSLLLFYIWSGGIWDMVVKNYRVLFQLTSFKQVQ